VDRVLELLEKLHPDFDFDNACDFVEEGLLDSLDIVALVPMIEEEFDIEIPGAQVIPDNFQNLRTLQNFIESRRAQRAVI
jgi:D-alanine--poly(phosphoribitol) ligase subunit 2